MNTYSAESTWGTTLDFEEVRLMCWFVGRERADREAKLRRYMSKLPLHIKIHWAAFGLTSPRLVWEPPQIELKPAQPSGYGIRTRVMCLAPPPIWTTVL